MDYTVHGILQARILEWVAAPFSRGSSQPRDRTQVSHICLTHTSVGCLDPARLYGSISPLAIGEDKRHVEQGQSR